MTEKIMTDKINMTEKIMTDKIMTDKIQTIVKKNGKELRLMLQFLSKIKIKQSNHWTTKQWYQYLLTKHHSNDEDIYNELRTLTVPENKFDNTKRSTKLATNIVKLLPKNQPIYSFLDFGCGNGAITIKIMNAIKTLNMCYAVDVISPSLELVQSKCNYIQISEESIESLMQIPEHSVDLITCSMSLHHVRHLQPILEAFRHILSPNGIIIIREHDCSSGDFSIYLDIIHEFYSVVLSHPQEELIYSHYRSCDEWIHLFERYFRETQRLVLNNSMQAYYSVFMVCSHG